MRVLWLKTDLLLPLDKGGKLRTWHLMRQLATRHDITYVAFADPHENPAHLEGMREVATRVETVPRTDAPKASLRFFAKVAWHLADPLPYAVGQYRSRRYRRRIDELLAAGDFELAVVDFLPPIVNLPAALPCPTVLFTHNVESEIWRRHADTATDPLRRALYRTQHRRMLRFEGRALQQFDGVLAVSEADRETFARLYPGVDLDSIHVVRTGVDTEFFSPTRRSDNTVDLVFTGSMDWLPNEDGVLWFCREVLPRIRRDVPHATVSIVGRAPTPAVRSLAEQAGVRVTGRVDDVRPYVSDAAVVIVPLRIGGGTRLKIFEAMAMAKAVVSTTVGAEGLPVTSEQDILLADEPGRFARAVVRLLTNVSARRNLGTAARRLVAAHFDWSAVAKDLEYALLQVSRSPRARAAAFQRSPRNRSSVQRSEMPERIR